MHSDSHPMIAELGAIPELVSRRWMDEIKKLLG